MKMIKIDVGGMASESDVNKLNAILSESIFGVKMADAVLKEHAVYIIIDNHIYVENIKNLIKKAGYSPGLHISWVIS